MKDPERRLPRLISQAEKRFSTVGAQAIGLVALLYANYVAFGVAPTALPQDRLDQTFYLAICAGPVMFVDAFLAFKLVDKLLAEPEIVVKQEWQPRVVEGSFMVQVPGENPRSLEFGEQVEVVATPHFQLSLSPVNGGDVMALKMQRHVHIPGETEGEVVQQTSLITTEWGPAHLLPAISRREQPDKRIAVDISANRLVELADGCLEVAETDLIFSPDFRELFVKNADGSVRSLAVFNWHSLEKSVS